MTETRIKARRYRIFQLSTHDCMTKAEREIYDTYKSENNKDRKKELRAEFDKLLDEFEGVRSIPNSRLYKTNADGTLSTEYRKEIQNPMFESAMARFANDFKEKYPFVNEIVYLECSLRRVLEQIIENGLMIEGEKYIFFSANTNQMKKEMVILLKESFFVENEEKIMCGLTRDKINKGNERVKGCNRGKYLAYTSLPMSASVEVSSINTDTEQYEIDIDECIVVADFEGQVHGKVNFLDVETLKAEIKEMPVDIPFMDGAGIYLPNSGVLPRTGQIRGGYFKGCLFPFDFKTFVETKEGANSEIKDIYGDTVDVIKQGIKVIFTGSQFKMWKYYENWEEFKRVFKECGCKIVLNNLAHEPEKNSIVYLTYQFLQTIRRDRFTEEAMEKLCEKTVETLNGAKTNLDIALKLLGIIEDDTKELKPLQAAIKLYPALVNDKAVKQMIQENINILRKKAMGGKVMVDGFYTYICPDLYAFCEWLFCNEKAPKGLVPRGMVYNAYYNDTDITEVDCLRSPHLGDSEHCVRQLVKTDECKKWFKGYNTVISNHDLITKHLMCDCDGDEMLITSSKELIDLVDRDKPALYYKMEKAKEEEITDKVLYDCLISSFDNSIIGDISNVITKLYSVDEEPDYELIRILTAYNNYTIDYPKTQKAMDLKQFTEVYKEWTDNKKHKLPQFFRYAKGKSEKVVASYNSCNVDRVCQYIEKSVTKKRYTIFDTGEKMSPEILKDPYIEVVRTSEEYIRLVKLLEELHYKAKETQERTSKVKNKLTENKGIDEDGLKVDLYYYMCREAILQLFNGAEYKAATYLVDAEYYQPQLVNSNKKLIWNCFGNIIVDNIRNRLQSGIKPKVRRMQYITKGSELYKNIVNAFEETKVPEKEVKFTSITDKELEWIDEQAQGFRKGCTNDRELLFIFLYLQKRYSNKDGYFKLCTKVKNGVTTNTIDKWIDADVCKKGMSRLEKKGLIDKKKVTNQYGTYILIHVKMPTLFEETVVFEVSGGNPLILFYKNNKEKVIKSCVVCGKEFVADKNLKTCNSQLCKKKLEKDTKDKCNKNAC